MADRGRKALPVDNRLCNDKWVERCQRIHREKLATMQSTATDPRLKTLDNRIPHTMSMTHLTHRLKKAQLEEERFQEIELENKVLLGKMSKIMGLSAMNDRSSQGGKGASQFPFRSTLQLKPGVRIDMGQYPCLDTRNYYPNKSLNRDFRVRELRRINDQNQSMLARIQTREPFYDHKKWDAERTQDLKYLANIKSREVIGISKKFKIQATLPPLPHSPKSMSNNNSLRFGSMSPKAVSVPSTPALAENSAATEEAAPTAVET
mmetsp:Transcript_22516/g.55729  ORF Transcript_22516/g.55729 Transcript_22516/m.55729 type:complete len:263 (-) Transcript_22516:437-1225(-)|eukprot:CAMPEP_0181364512 /NCGR_PEP_ID=MMETSP1106-20121128/9451_1 /TAXON_ID=81844 /ORGANISM="Mantoniella antarctica, Strain SL-175" /LENGTH=262 /DNA_ID=CAMNT_0023479281 /DNA_START=179 /DNA_END=967 /DNA_ORIENTATION=-